MILIKKGYGMKTKDVIEDCPADSEKLAITVRTADGEEIDLDSSKKIEDQFIAKGFFYWKGDDFYMICETKEGGIFSFPFPQDVVDKMTEENSALLRGGKFIVGKVGV